MDNLQSVSEVQPSIRQPRVSGVLSVKRLDPSSMKGEEMSALWDKIKTQDYAFDDLTRNDPRAFILGLVAPASFHFQVNDSIYVVCRNVWQHANVDFHFIVYDKAFPMRDSIEAGRQILEWLFKEKQVCRVSGFIPKFNTQATRFASMMGFKYEGTMRQSVKHFEKFYDVDIYGLLPKEFERRFQQ